MAANWGEVPLCCDSDKCVGFKTSMPQCFVRRSFGDWRSDPEQPKTQPRKTKASVTSPSPQRDPLQLHLKSPPQVRVGDWLPVRLKSPVRAQAPQGHPLKRKQQCKHPACTLCCCSITTEFDGYCCGARRDDIERHPNDFPENHTVPHDEDCELQEYAN